MAIQASIAKPPNLILHQYFHLYSNRLCPDTVKNSEGVVASWELLAAGVQLGVQLPEDREGGGSHPDHEALVALGIIDLTRPIREQDILWGQQQKVFRIKEDGS